MWATVPWTLIYALFHAKLYPLTMGKARGLSICIQKSPSVHLFFLRLNNVSPLPPRNRVEKNWKSMPPENYDSRVLLRRTSRSLSVTGEAENFTRLIAKGSPMRELSSLLLSLISNNFCGPRWQCYNTLYLSAPIGAILHQVCFIGTPVAPPIIIFFQRSANFFCSLAYRFGKAMVATSTLAKLNS